ncbi:MAG: hypothetical protein JJE34_02200 [Alphaproteobacteria bacterium]|nr:hypothetical protein [Alphaproteobacteria bacterium]
MRKTLIGLGSLAIALAAATPAFAQDDNGITVSGGAALVTDYRFRGVSQTDKEFAVQGNLTVAHSSGLYATVWGSSIDDYVANGSDQEIDLVGGYKRDFGGATVDVGATYYYFPGSNGANTDFIEPYIAVSSAFGPVTAKVTAAYAPKQNALSIDSGKEDNLYLAGDLSTTVPGTPFSLSAHLGNSFGRSYLTSGYKDVTDWSLGASYAYKNLTFGVSYVDTEDTIINAASGKNIAKAGVVGSVGVSF